MKWPSDDVVKVLMLKVSNACPGCNEGGKKKKLPKRKRPMERLLMKNGALAKNSVRNTTGKQCMSKPIMSPCADT